MIMSQWVCNRIPCTLYFSVNFYFKHDMIYAVHVVPTFAISSSQIWVNSSFSLTFCSTLLSRDVAFISVFFNIAVNLAISASWERDRLSISLLAFSSVSSAWDLSRSYFSSCLWSFVVHSSKQDLRVSSFCLNPSTTDFVLSYCWI